MADNRIIFPPLPIPPLSGQSRTKSAEIAIKSTFGQVLEKELTDVKFSQHAKERLQVRNIKLGQAELAKLTAAVDKAAAKGARESLVLMDNVALVVSVKNRTVITAVDGASLKDNVFTNIDSAVII
ncbi:flagellar protein [Anaerosporomusa subterranea]|uniref:Flagellar protein n=1 Tax=Anaerosporomusa subterranea TaxID=1794912 RepID=A0A154BUY2_ANASB|nr:flagellar protein [Anaerosporomusa subterranea]